MSQVKLRGYKFLIEMGRITVDDVPEPYRAEIEEENDTTE
jgi:hypothetical protein